MTFVLALSLIAAAAVVSVVFVDSAVAVVVADSAAASPTRPPAPPKQCFHSAQCLAGQVCIFPVGSCGFDGNPGGCMVTRGMICPAVYNPVCGCNGRTYSNACVATSAGVSISYKGPCTMGPTRCYANSQCNQTNGEYCLRPVGSCGGSFLNGNCTAMPQFCTLQYQPVCGCDGITYGNPCLAQAAGMTIALNGPCQSAADDCTDDTDCHAGDFCMYSIYSCAGNGTCTAKPQICPQSWLPCCGCDQQTYSNDCFANMNGTNCASFGSCT